jgi:hypothetical protein
VRDWITECEGLTPDSTLDALEALREHLSELQIPQIVHGSKDRKDPRSGMRCASSPRRSIRVTSPFTALDTTGARLRKVIGWRVSGARCRAPGTRRSFFAAGIAAFSTIEC